MALNLPIQGQGFVVRDFAASDIQALADIEFDPLVKRYLAIPDKRKDEWVKAFDIRVATGWAVVVDNRTVAGRASLTRAERKGDAELAIVISRAFWGYGLGTKVATLLVGVAFEQLDAKAVVCVVHPENRASLRLLRLLHFRRRGILFAPIEY
jgi:RimJ/RimL family protein N-acetyltransferase